MLTGFEIKPTEFSRGMKPTAGETLHIETFVGYDAEFRGRIWIPCGEKKPAILVGDWTGTVHDGTVCEWGSSYRGLPGLWSGTTRLYPWENVSQ